MSHIAIVYFSSRGHTRKLAESIYQGVMETNSSAVLIDVTDVTEVDISMLKNASGILWGSPTYMGSIAAPFKSFIDDLSKKGLWVNQVLANKMAGGFTIATYPSGDKLNTLIQLALISAQHGMIWVNHIGLGEKVSGDRENPNTSGSWLGLMATSNQDKKSLISKKDHLTAVSFGKRFAKALIRWNN